MRHTITGPVGPDGADLAVEFHIRKLKDSRPREGTSARGERLPDRGERWEARCLTEDDAGRPLFKRLVYTSAERCIEGAQALVDKRATDLAEAEQS